MTSVTSTTQEHTLHENDNLEILHIHTEPDRDFSKIHVVSTMYQIKNHNINVRRLKKNLICSCQNKLLQACTWITAEEVLRRPKDKFPLHNIQTW